MGSYIGDGGSYYDCGSSSKEFRSITRILAKNFWLCHKRYVNSFKARDGSIGDLGWFYNERANISFLAAAAWHEPKWIAIEEYACSKEVAKEKSRGRADLFIGTPKLCLSIEAKIAWTATKKQLHACLDASNPRSQLSSAVSDAQKTPANGMRCGAVFVCPNVNASNKDKLDSAIEEIFDSFWASTKGLMRFKHWAAFSFVSPNPGQVWKQKAGPVAYPAVGVVLVSA